MIFHDPYAGHRRWWDPNWKPDESSRDWTDWDFLLARTYQVILDYTDNESGQLMWLDQSGDVWWDVKSKFSGSLAAIENERSKRGDKLKPGESLYAVPVFNEEAPLPTMESWIKDIEEDKADLRPAQMREARPPTPEELSALRERRSKRSIDDELVD